MNEARCNTVGACGGGVYVCRPWSAGAVGSVAGCSGYAERIFFGVDAHRLC
jgi:hypothetical protein